MDKVKIGFPIEYEDENNIVRNGLFLREPEIKELEKRLKEINKITELEQQCKKQKEVIDKITKDDIGHIREAIKGYTPHLERKMKIKDAYLKTILDRIYKFDDDNTVQKYIDLVNEIIFLANLGLTSNETTPIYDMSDGFSENILGEKIIKGEN